MKKLTKLEIFGFSINNCANLSKKGLINLSKTIRSFELLKELKVEYEKNKEKN
jgi:hypothetical protein